MGEEGRLACKNCLRQNPENEMEDEEDDRDFLSSEDLGGPF